MAQGVGEPLSTVALSAAALSTEACGQVSLSAVTARPIQVVALTG
jgi:hypothetical protein